VSWDENLASTSRSLGSSLSRSITNSKITNFKQEIKTKIQELKTTMSNRLAQQDQHLHEIKNSINNLTQDFESRMAVAVIEALMREKDKVQELTLGKTYGPDHAPLADKHGLLPGGVKARAGGPLDQLHHVKITVQRMATILESMIGQQDLTARLLFAADEEESDMESEHMEDNNMATEIQYYTDGNIPKSILRESGSKRLHKSSRTKGLPSKNHNPDNPPSPHQTPPPKRERSDSKPSAKPDGTARAWRES
jgi:hypothetical protein